MKNIRKLLVATCLVVALVALVLACGHTASRAPDGGDSTSDAGAEPSAAPGELDPEGKPKHGSVNPYATGSGLTYNLNGLPSLTVLAWADAGLTAYVLTANPDGGVAYWAPASGGLSAGGDIYLTLDGGGGVGWISGYDAGFKYGDAGQVIKILADQSNFGPDGGVTECMNYKATISDSTTWVNVFTYKSIATRSMGVIDVQMAGYDIADAPDSGPVDHFTCRGEWTITSSNNGTILAADFSGNNGMDGGISLTNLSCTACVSGVCTGSTTVAQRWQLSSSDGEFQIKGLASKTYNVSIAMCQLRSF